jgi:hypothetical protein
MTGTTVDRVDMSQADVDAPPADTAIMRPLRHVQAVRERHAQQLAERSHAGESRAARAWSWTLGETAIAPVTDRATAVPPTRLDIEAEVAEADERRLRGDRENRADAAATILRWLIGEDDRVPIHTENPGELVGGFGDVVRSPAQIAAVLAAAQAGQHRIPGSGHVVGPRDRQAIEQDVAYLDGVIATLTWVLGERSAAPITGARSSQLTTRDLKAERVHAEDVTDQASRPWMVDRLPPPCYGEAVMLTIAWLLGETIATPVDA